MSYFLFLTSLPFATCAYFIHFISHSVTLVAHVCLNHPSLQRAKEEMGERHPSYLDTGYAIGVVLLFVSKWSQQPLIWILLLKLTRQPKVSGIVLSIELPSRCYSGSNEHFRAVGRGVCDVLTVMAACAWLGVLTSKSRPGHGNPKKKKFTIPHRQ